MNLIVQSVGYRMQALTDSYWCECTFDNMGLRKDNKPILFESNSREEFDIMTEKLKRFVQSRYPKSKCIQFEHRLTFALATPSRYKSDRAKTLAIVVLHSSIADQMVGQIYPEDTLPPYAIGSEAEVQVSNAIKPLVEQLLKDGMEPRAIPVLFANASFLTMLQNGTLKLDASIQLE